jgi:hypothetical protein
MSDATATATPEPAPKVDHVAALRDSFVNIVKNFKEALTPEQTTSVQEVYRAIPSASRSKAQGEALKAVLEAGGDSVVMGALLDATTNLPRATGTPKARVQLDPVTQLAIQAAGTLVAFADITSDPEIGQEVAKLARGWYSDGVPDEHKDAVLRSASNAVKGASKRSGGGGGGGARRSFTDTLANIVERGDIKAGSTLQSGKDGVTAKVLKSGELKVGDETFANPSAAAKHIAGEGSVNGWAYFSYDGKKLGEYRQSA